MQPITVMVVETGQSQAISIQDLERNSNIRLLDESKLNDYNTDTVGSLLQEQEGTVDFIESTLDKIDRLNPKTVLIKLFKSTVIYWLLCTISNRIFRPFWLLMIQSQKIIFLKLYPAELKVL